MDSPRPDRIFRALSDPVRLRIVRVLLDGEMCVGDMVTILRVPQPTASRHLAYLRRVGLITARKNSYWSFYTLAPTRSPFGRALLECVKAGVADAPGVKQDGVRARRLREQGGCCAPHLVESCRQPTAQAVPLRKRGSSHHVSG
jgi:ArsR family transcriptional regulator